MLQSGDELLDVVEAVIQYCHIPLVLFAGGGARLVPLRSSAPDPTVLRVCFAGHVGHIVWGNSDPGSHTILLHAGPLVHVVVALPLAIPLPVPLALSTLLPLLVQLHPAVRRRRRSLAHHHGHAGGSAAGLCGRGSPLLGDHLAAAELLQVLNQMDGGHTL